MQITKIISGGQTGADRGGLDAAIACDIPHGGWCPRGRRAEDGCISGKYQLQETQTFNYSERTKSNVIEADATLIFTMGDLNGGSLQTKKFAKQYHRPYLHVDIKKDEQAVCKKILDWLNQLSIDGIILNIAGSRESKNPGIQNIVMSLIIHLLQWKCK